MDPVSTSAICWARLNLRAHVPSGHYFLDDPHGPSFEANGWSLTVPGAGNAYFDCDGPFNATRRALWMASEGPPLSRASWASSPGGCKNLQVWVLVETCLRKLQLQPAMSDPDVMAVAKAK